MTDIVAAPSPVKSIDPALQAEIATTRDGRDITQPWVAELREARDPRLALSIDWGVYDKVLLDDQVKSTLSQRRGAVVSRDWSVLPGEKGDPRAEAAAQALKRNIERVGWDRVTDKMLYAPFYGYAVAELMWEYRDGLWQWSAVKVRHARRFRWDKDDRLRLLTSTNMTGEILPDRKFWTVSDGASDDDQPYGRGLAEWLYWPTLFKREGIGFWNTFLDKFGAPTAMGKYPRGTSEADIQKLLGALEAISTDTGIAVPEGVAIELLGAARSGTGDFEQLCRYMDEAIARIVLSQTMTSMAAHSGLGSNQANVHADVKKDVIKSDADLLTDSFSSGPARWWTDYNFGTDVAAPRVVRLVEDEADVAKEAETDTSLSNLGWERTDESFRDTYGDGYRRKAAVVPPNVNTGAPPIDKPGVLATMSFAELLKRGDIVDDATGFLAEQGWSPIEGMTQPIVTAIEQAKSEDELDEALLGGLDQAQVDKLVEAMARAGFAVRVAAEAGADQ